MKKIRIILLILPILLNSCCYIKNNKTEFDDKVIFHKNLYDCKIDIIDKSNVFGWSYNQQKLILINYNKIEYRVGINSSDEIVYALTWDKKFISPDSVKVGDTFEEIKSISTFKTAYSDNFVYLLNSGWLAIVKYEYYEYQNFPDDSSRVVWLEKYEN